MKTYIITLQLGYQEETYINLVAYLKTAVYWARPMSNVWVIKTAKSAAEIRDGINPLININLGDKVMVIESGSKNWATNNVAKNVTDWMKSNI